ncbi:meteorin-like protein [Dendronephthya gigantea]|uniref:meteorin-like protein n=1 Tax=Dendronephthya gigantea TaxID=151771 RepID=UPI00106B464C|nr:meteorin-like protein [Dendronephthya gigantea]XP_028406611.1 meteorin-like protein [Dendronephthya gigantea]
MISFGATWHLLLFILVLVSSEESDIIEGLCNWTVRAAERTMPASVSPVHFYACERGQLTWEEPYGGVQMTFKSAVPEDTHGAYNVCISSLNTGFDIFTQNKDNFKLLRSYKTLNTSADICVSSQGKNVMIYMESGKNIHTKKAVFTYRTVFLGNGRGSRRPKDCKICSRKELIKSFCNSDFAVHGNVKHMSTVGGAKERGEVLVVVKKVLRQTANIFQSKGSSSEILGSVNFPLYCHWKKRSKHGYLFTGKLEPGWGPVVRCRIKFGLWRRLYHRKICSTIVART